MDDLQIALRPRAAFGVRIELIELSKDLIDLAVGQVGVLSESNAWVLAFEMDSDAVKLAGRGGSR